jgi:hypothetical protein
MFAPREKCLHIIVDCNADRKVPTLLEIREQDAEGWF